METEDIGKLTAELRDLNITVLAQLEAAAIDCESERSAGRATAPAVFHCGDQVKIKNKLQKPAMWPINTKWDQKAAQHNYKGQVHFRTDNGVKTWRAHSNLQKLMK